MTSAREVRASLRRQALATLNAQLDAATAVVRAGQALADAQARAETRKARLREQLERDLAAEDAKVTTREVAAGEAVLAAVDAALNERQLHQHTRIPLADLRQWTRQARLGADGSADAGSEQAEPGLTEDAVDVERPEVEESAAVTAAAAPATEVRVGRGGEGGAATTLSAP